MHQWLVFLTASQLLIYYLIKIEIVSAIQIITRLKWDVFIKLVLLYNYKICRMRKILFSVMVFIFSIPMISFSQEVVDASVMQKIRE